MNHSFLETDKLFRQNLLLNEIEGITTNYYVIQKQQKHTFEPISHRARVLIILSDTGLVCCKNYSYQIKEKAVLAPLHNSAVTVESTVFDFELLEILMDLTSEDLRKMNCTSEGGFFFKHYSEAVPYREEIKSPKTVSRMLLPANVIPRMVLGSVEAEGPDQVQAHRHPMLEQLFWGLPGNQCWVKADEHEKHFGENTLLHIPSGSEHSVQVKKGKYMHYIWIDFFKDSKDVSYILDSHLSDKE